MQDKILIINVEQTVRQTLSQALREWDYSPVLTATVAEAIEAFEGERPAAVLLDINLPDGSSLEALREIKRRQPDAVVIVMTASVLFDQITAALKAGASDFIGQPVNLQELEVRIRTGIETQSSGKKVSSMRRERSPIFSFDQIIGSSPAMREMLRLARKVAESEVSCVLLQGESGTGKDCVAKAIHCASKRAHAPFVAINCAAIPANLIESELFGHEKGAFTDARAR
jgi:DNA-binding NtrC family response regulator